MIEVKPLPLGAVTYFPRSDVDERPAFFEVSFVIECTDPDAGVDYGHQIEVGMPVVAEGWDQTYGRIEELGAQALPAFFRGLADAVERDLSRSKIQREKERSADGGAV